MSRRVLAVLHEEVEGGATLALLRVLPFLEEGGYEFEFWAPRPSALADALVSRGRVVHGLPRHMRFSVAGLREPPGPRARAAGVVRSLRALRALVGRRDYDLVHLNTLLTMPEALALRRSGVPRLLHVHEMVPADIRGRASSAAIRASCDAVVAVSDASAAALAALGVPARVAYNGVRLAEPPRPADRQRPVVGAVGTVSKRKGSDLVLEVARALRARRAEVDVRLIGPLAPGPEKAWARELVGRAAAAGASYTGQWDMPAVLGEVDVVLVPSRSDPFPLVVLEAMAAEVPVVATRVDGIPEQLSEDTGLLVESEDVAGLADAVCALAEDPARRRAKGAAARARVAREFTLERQAEALLGAYAEALAGARTCGRSA